MPPTVIKRVDLESLEKQKAQSGVSVEAAGSAASLSVRWIILPVSIVLCVSQAVLTIIASNLRNTVISNCIVPIVALAVLFLLVLLVNPLLKLIHPVTSKVGFVEWFLRPFGRAELLTVFTAMAVTAGISTFGLTEQLVPLVATPFNPAWRTPQSGWNEKLIPAMKHELYIQDPQAIRTFREGFAGVDPQNFKQPLDSASASEWASYAWRVAQEVPWSTWATPLAYWLIFIGASYLLFYSLTYVVLGYWADREKLIFPIARLSESLLPDDRDKSWLPPTLRSPGFWGGCFFVLALLSWNALATSGHVPRLPLIPLGMGQNDFNSVVQNTFLSGMGAGTGRSDGVPGLLIMFTAIGLAFLLPLEISFSVWFYYLASRFSMVIASWMGFGKDLRDYPSDWLWQTNHVTSQAAGGFFVFCAVGLWKCLRDYRLLTQGKPWGEKFRLAIPVVGLVVSLVIIIAWLQWNNLPLIWAIVFTVMLVIMTIGLMRIVSEAGIYWFQSHTSFFHLYKVFGLGKFALAPLSPVLLGPLLPIYSVLFLDTKTFMAPSLINSASMGKEARVSRVKFHVNLVLCIAITVIVSVGTAILLAHIVGANTMNSWFYTGGPKDYVMGTALQATIDVPKFQPWNAVWYGVGAIWVALSMFLRTMFFWFPHPAGYIMLINPLMSQLWFPFFLGWVCKRIVVKYGGKTTFDRVRDVFIGLIVGELLAITLWIFVAVVFRVPNLNLPTLNRYN